MTHLSLETLPAQINHAQGASRTKRFYIGLPLLFYVGSSLMLLVFLPFFSIGQMGNCDPFSRILAVLLWALCAPKLMRPDEPLFRNQSWQFSRENLACGMMSALFILPAFFSVASLFDMSKLVRNFTLPSWPPALVLLLLVNSFVTPFVEELLWRGVLWNRLAQTHSIAFVILATSVGFGLAHIISDFSFVRVPAVLVFGFGCGFVRKRWGLSASIATHCTANFLAGIYAFFPAVAEKVNAILPHF